MTSLIPRVQQVPMGLAPARSSCSHLNYTCARKITGGSIGSWCGVVLIIWLDLCCFNGTVVSWLWRVSAESQPYYSLRKQWYKAAAGEPGRSWSVRCSDFPSLESCMIQWQAKWPCLGLPPWFFFICSRRRRAQFPMNPSRDPRFRQKRPE